MPDLAVIESIKKNKIRVYFHEKLNQTQDIKAAVMAYDTIEKKFVNMSELQDISNTGRYILYEPEADMFQMFFGEIMPGYIKALNDLNIASEPSRFIGFYKDLTEEEYREYAKRHMIDDSTYKSTYQILQEIAKVWDILSDIDQAALLEYLAGKRNANTVKSVITNLKDLEGAYQSASNATGTLAVANETYMDSIEAKTKVLQASFEQLSIDTIDSGLVKGILDAANALVVLLDKTNLVKSALAGLIVGGAIKGITAIATGITKATIQMNQFNAALGMLKAGNLGEAEFAQLVKLTGQLSAAQLKAVVSSQALTAEQRLAILTATGMSEAEAAQTLATMGLATAEGTDTAATFSLSAAFTALITPAIK